MEKKEMVCIVCPIGCHLEIIVDAKSETGYTVSGSQCDRGKTYGIKELSNPTRLVTSTVKIIGGNLPRLPVRTDKEIPKDKIFECMKIINVSEIQAPVEMGQIIVENILGTNSNLVASRSLH
ncbi:DUF1667 domain-containing protein [Tissierella sp. Yu-01]|uniref:DUF1667 domain-containing protein n=1 Tax=Tissierella sp. Yu-01 TaxID=3035694 RepID=UPI00240E54C5|nr:DUF1667 domain-containing protein [Tissierella sp. Yu-01]WFA08381.1 DUF1667 domain-containing protein [Tissierella sp. Yu-01]